MIKTRLVWPICPVCILVIEESKNLSKNMEYADSKYDVVNNM